jgi:hypothetical protein
MDLKESLRATRWQSASVSSLVNLLLSFPHIHDILDGYPRQHLDAFLDNYRRCLELHGVDVSDEGWRGMKERAIPLIVERLRKAG